MTKRASAWRLLTRGDRRRAALLVVLMFVGMILESLGIGFVVPLVAILSRPDSGVALPVVRSLMQALGSPTRDQLVVGAMLTLVGLYVIKTGFLVFLAWRQTRFAFEVQATLSQRLFTAYLRQDYQFHLKRNSAQLLRNVTGELGIFTNFAMIPGLVVIAESMVLLGLCSLLVLVEPLGALTTFGVIGLAAWIFNRLSRARVAHWGQERHYHEGLRIQHLQQGLGAAKDVKVLGREAEFLEQYRKHNVRFTRAAQLQATIEQLPRLWLELLAICGLVTLVLAMQAQGRGLDTVLPTLGLFAAAAFRIAPSANRLIVGMQSLRYGLPVVETLSVELALNVPEPPTRGPKIVPFATGVEFRDVTFKYEGSRSPVLSALSLKIRRGESVGIIGASGAGKSTLVDILLGLLKPDSGSVIVDGKDVRSELRNWQDQVGYVPQSIFLIDDTIRRNIAFGLPDDRINEEALWSAIRAAQLDEFVRSLPDGTGAVVGERGIRLSGGQRQRIGIARALYHDPAILVLDEATSSLDTAIERGVMQSVYALHGAKTIVIVAHRLSTVEHCDRLYRLENGRIVMEGTPGEVLRA